MKRLRLSYSVACFLAAAALAGCDQLAEILPTAPRDDPSEAAGMGSEADDDAIALDDAPSVPVEIPVTDRFAPGDDAVLDIGFWRHPTLAFASLVVVAGEDGLRAVVVETGADAGTLSARADAIDIAYLGDQGVVVGVDGGARDLFVAAIDNITQEMTIAAQVKSDLAAGATGVCLAQDLSDPAAARGFVVGPGGAAAIRISGAGADIAIDLSTTAAAPARARDCIINPTDGAVYFLTGDGDIVTGESRIAGGMGARAIGLMVKTTRTDDLDTETQSDDAAAAPWTPEDGPILAVMSDNGVVSLIRAADGAALGAIALAASFDYPAVEAATAMAIGVGNYGGVYRDGAIALGAGNGANIVPWNAAANRLSLPIGAGVNPRAPQPEEDDGFRIDISPTQP